jgi:hypothetical protein
MLKNFVFVFKEIRFRGNIYIPLMETSRERVIFAESERRKLGYSTLNNLRPAASDVRQ